MRGGPHREEDEVEDEAEHSEGHPDEDAQEEETASPGPLPRRRVGVPHERDFVALLILPRHAPLGQERWPDFMGPRNTDFEILCLGCFSIGTTEGNFAGGWRHNAGNGSVPVGSICQQHGDKSLPGRLDASRVE